MSRHRTPDEFGHCTHPERRSYALGLCEACYHAYYRRARKALGRPMHSMMSQAQRKAAA